jgi:hypothetical protein
MIWLTWRQFRAQTIAAAAVLTVLAVIFAVTGPHLAHLYDVSGIATCHGTVTCGNLATTALNKLAKVYPIVYFAGIFILLLAPALIGAFWGAPLVTREIEARTLSLAWNQTVTRTRWMAAKLGLIGLAAMATAGLLSLMLTWWASPLDRMTRWDASGSLNFSRLEFPLFDVRGIVPVGYAAFAFVLGVTAGVVIRRTLPAMAVTLAGFAAVQFAWPTWIRPSLIAPVHAILPFSAAAASGLNPGPDHTLSVLMPATVEPDAWIYSSQVINAAGQPFNAATIHACVATETGGSFPACQAALGRVYHLRQLVSYQPASRFWAFQGYEAASFLAAALLLAGFCVWWIYRRRLP